MRLIRELLGNWPCYTWFRHLCFLLSVCLLYFFLIFLKILVKDHMIFFLAKSSKLLCWHTFKYYLLITEVDLLAVMEKWKRRLFLPKAQISFLALNLRAISQQIPSSLQRCRHSDDDNLVITVITFFSWENI